METNLLPCKRCGKEFNYIQNISGNARQLCKECRMIVDDEELNKLEERTIIEGNRYLIGAPGRKDEYDPIDILLEGNMPEFESDADRFICAAEMAAFIRKTGITGIENNIEKLFKHIGGVHSVLIIKLLPLNMCEKLARRYKV